MECLTAHRLLTSRSAQRHHEITAGRFFPSKTSAQHFQSTARSIQRNRRTQSFPSIQRRKMHGAKAKAKAVLGLGAWEKGGSAFLLPSERLHPSLNTNRLFYNPPSRCHFSRFPIDIFWILFSVPRHKDSGRLIARPSSKTNGSLRLAIAGAQQHLLGVIDFARQIIGPSPIRV